MNRADCPQRQNVTNATNISPTRAAGEAARAGLELRRGPNGLEVSDGHMELRGDFSSMTARLKPANLSHELIVRAAKLKPADDTGRLTAVDATAGLGEDSLLLAAAGFDVVLYERNPVIAALLQDALERARGIPALAVAAGRMHVVEEDSVEALRRLGMAPDVVLLDPMFPAKQKSASAKKKLQIIQRLERPCEDERALLEAAIAANPRKIVVKRPAKGPYLAGKKPSYSLAGKAVRYDCIALGGRDRASSTTAVV